MTAGRRLVGLLLLVASAAASAQLSDTEQRIVSAIKQRSPQALELLERSVRINSGTLNVDGVKEAGQVFRRELDAMGFRTRWIDMPPEMKRGGHLAATREGAGKRVLLLGHIDTVFEKDTSVPPWELRGDRVRGQGVNDMKGGNVVLLEALRGLQAAGALEGANIDVLLTGDEERTGMPVDVARAHLVAMAKRSDFALSFEGTFNLAGGGAVATIARRSSGGWSLTVRGRPGHASGVFSPTSGFGAVYEAARILNGFREQLIEPSVTFNPGVIVGGTNVSYSDDTASGTAFGKTNVISRDVVVRGDLRYLTPEQGERVRERMRRIVAQSLPGTTAQITFREVYPPMPPTEAGMRLVDMFSKASQDAGLGPIRMREPGQGGAGDIQFAAPHTVSMDGLGVVGRGAHTDDEDLEIASIERAAIRAAILIHRLTRP